MKVQPNVSADSSERFVQKMIDRKSVLFTDKNPAYITLEKIAENHIQIKSSKDSTKANLAWVHVAISNLKKNLLGIYQMVSKKHLQNYLNEFVNKLNRRYFGDQLFNRLIIASVYPYVRHCE